jgi:hypothetical protein
VVGSLQTKVELNGLRAKVVGFNEATGRRAAPHGMRRAVAPTAACACRA